MRLILLIAALSLTAACKKDETVRAYGGAGKDWHLSELNENPFTAKATLTFPEAGRIAGNAPCNSYNATMTVPYPWFEVGPIAATKRACPDLAAEAAFFAALDTATLSEVQGNFLILSNTDGLSMVFTAAD
ncbi:MAG: META domain-containing protein [Sulfitobacter sp.]